MARRETISTLFFGDFIKDFKNKRLALPKFNLSKP